MDIEGLMPEKIRSKYKDSYRYRNSDGDIVAKTCAKCHTVVSINKFPTNKYNADGYSSWCATCTSLEQAKYRENYGNKYSVDKSHSMLNKYRSRTDAELEEEAKKSYPNGLKVCPTCSLSMPLDSFYRNSSYKDTTSPYCKKCTIAESKKRKSNKKYTISPEKHKEYSKTHSTKMKARTDEEIEEVIKTKFPDGTKKCKSCRETKLVTEYHKQRQLSTVLSRYCKKCRSRKGNERKKRKYEKYWVDRGIPLVCYVCENPYEHVDHVIPESLGGPDDPYNRLPMCAMHNISKWKTPLTEWLSAKHPDVKEEVLQRVSRYGVAYELSS